MTSTYKKVWGVVLMLAMSCVQINAARVRRCQPTHTNSRGLFGNFFKNFKKYRTDLYNFWCDGVIVGHLGTKQLAKENEQFIRAELRKLDLYCADTIRIKRLSPRAVYGGCGPKNAMVVHLGNFWPQYMFVQEEWFNSLTPAKKRFLIAHEAMHLKHSHVQKMQLYSLFGMYAILGVGVTGVYLLSGVPFVLAHPVVFKALGYVAGIMLGFGYAGAIAAQSRKYEYEADTLALLATKDIGGGCQVLQELGDFAQSVEDELPQWNLLKVKRNWTRKWFGSHPKAIDRIARLEKVYKEQVDPLYFKADATVSFCA